jgi:hypothetical protein
VDGRDDKPGTIAILDISGVHLGTDQQPARVGDNVTFAAFDFLGRIVAARPAALGRLDRLTVDDPGRWAGVTPAASRASSSSAKLIVSNKPLSRQS